MPSLPRLADLFGVRHHQIHHRLDAARVAVRVRRVCLEQDRVAGLEAMRIARDVDLDAAGGDDEVLGRAGRVRICILDGAAGQAKLVELDAARLVEREQRARVMQPLGHQ